MAPTSTVASQTQQQPTNEKKTLSRNREYARFSKTQTRWWYVPFMKREQEHPYSVARSASAHQLVGALAKYLFICALWPRFVPKQTKKKHTSTKIHLTDKPHSTPLAHTSRSSAVQTIALVFGGSEYPQPPVIYIYNIKTVHTKRRRWWWWRRRPTTKKIRAMQFAPQMKLKKALRVRAWRVLAVGWTWMVNRVGRLGTGRVRTPCADAEVAEVRALLLGCACLCASGVLSSLRATFIEIPCKWEGTKAMKAGRGRYRSQTASRWTRAKHFYMFLYYVVGPWALDFVFYVYKIYKRKKRLGCVK